MSIINNAYLYTPPSQQYSLDEVDTGYTWIDGKAIYRKCFKSYIDLSLTTGQLVAQLDNFDSICLLRCLTKLFNDSIVSVPYQTNARISINNSTGNIYFIQSSANMVADDSPIIIVVEYTKP